MDSVPNVMKTVHPNLPKARHSFINYLCYVIVIVIVIYIYRCVCGIYKNIVGTCRHPVQDCRVERRFRVSFRVVGERERERDKHKLIEPR